jgi:uncharacterized protein (DUF4415 family)
MVKKVKPRLNTPEEEVAIQRDIEASNDLFELTDAQLAAMRPFSEFMHERLNRPRKEAISIRIDADILHAFKSRGDGWQSRMNTALRQWLAEH